LFASTPFNAQWDQNIVSRQWEKLAINCAINPLTVLFDCHNGDLLSYPQATKLMSRISEEVHHLINQISLTKAPSALFERASSVAKDTAKNTSSTLQDVRRGNPTEIAYFNGYVAEQAIEHDIKLPCNTAIWEIFKNKRYNGNNAE